MYKESHSEMEEEHFSMDMKARGSVKKAGTVFEYIEDGGITSPKGFKASALNAGFKRKSDHPDLSLVVSDVLCSAAGVFTKNVFCAAPVQVSREHLGGRSYGMVQAAVINAGNANAATGDPGLQAARDTAVRAAEAIGCMPEEVLIASTGVIGVPIPFSLFDEHMDILVETLSIEGARDAAKAIMTTDTHPKECAVRFTSSDPNYEGVEFTVGGMAKGSGMIMPDMATLLAVLTTDVPLAPETSYDALVKTVGKSFNKVTVDSDTSTNDTCFLFANGMAAAANNADTKDEANGPLQPLAPLEEGSIAYTEFLHALDLVSVNLARMIAADGEGATKLVTVYVSGARDDNDADKAARAIANSPLVKTAIFGHDANWGRVAMALGKSGAVFQQEKVNIDFAGMPVCRDGLPVPFDEMEALRRFEASEIEIKADLGAGKAQTTIWTCDYSHDYVTINGDYRT